MPKILKTPGYGKTPYTGTRRPTAKLRVYKPNGTFDRMYQDFNQMEKWQNYYRNQGLKTRRLTRI